MKSKIIFSALFVGAVALAGQLFAASCAPEPEVVSVGPACEQVVACQPRCDLFSGLRKSSCRPANPCGGCNSCVVVSDVACEPVACTPVCKPVVCKPAVKPIACEPVIVQHAACEPVVCEPVCKQVCKPVVVRKSNPPPCECDFGCGCAKPAAVGCKPLMPLFPRPCAPLRTMQEDIECFKMEMRCNIENAKAERLAKLSMKKAVCGCDACSACEAVDTCEVVDACKPMPGATLKGILRTLFGEPIRRGGCAPSCGCDACFVEEVAPVACAPICKPVVKPVCKPVVIAECKPVCQPVVKPVCKPVCQPVVKPICQPVVKPVCQPVCQPVVKPVCQPVCKPVAKPVCQPVCKPACEPVAVAACEPACNSHMRPVIIQRQTPKPLMKPLCKPVMRSCCCNAAETCSVCACAAVGAEVYVQEVAVDPVLAVPTPAPEVVSEEIVDVQEDIEEPADEEDELEVDVDDVEASAVPADLLSIPGLDDFEDEEDAPQAAGQLNFYNASRSIVRN